MFGIIYDNCNMRSHIQYDTKRTDKLHDDTLVLKTTYPVPVPKTIADMGGPQLSPEEITPEVFLFDVHDAGSTQRELFDSRLTAIVTRVRAVF